MWRAPSPPEAREPALRHYLAAEASCDAGSVAAGTRSFKAAYDLAWELGTENWPGWANNMYLRLHALPPDSALPPDGAPQILAEDGDEYSRRGRHTQNDGSWWMTDEAITRITARLTERNFVVIDNFTGADDAAGLRAACIDLSHRNVFEPAKNRVREGGRSDSVAWEPDGFENLVRRTDALLRLWRERCAGVRGVTARQRAMVSRYGCDDFFARHVDNSCVDGQGPYCSPRVLSMCYYMQSPDAASADSWDGATDGGCLRIFRPQVALKDEVAAAADSGDADALIDIAPIGDRLVVFFSDFRCPHEVMAVRRANAERFAATVWYMGPEALPEFWTSEERRSQLKGDHELFAV